MAKVIDQVKVVRANGSVEKKPFVREGNYDEATQQTTSMIFQSPNGTKWVLKVDDLGIVSTLQV